MSRALAALAAMTLAAGLPVAGCGGDDSPTDTVTTPAAPATTSSTTTRETTTTTTTSSSPTTTTRSTTTTSSSSGNANHGSGGTKPSDGDHDRPGHDIPPPPGSPAEQAEQFCDEHPGAC
jgi:hypothetical protein